MSRLVGQFCPRDSMPSAAMEVSETQSAPSTHIEREATDSSMTWQQKKKFGSVIEKTHERKTKGVHWTPLDLETIEAPPVASIVGDGRSWSEQQAGFPIVSKRQHHHPRDKVKGSSTSNPNPAQPIESSTSPIEAPNPHKNKNTRRRPRNQKGKESKDMDPLPKSAYVPPHLRKRVDAPAASNDSSATSAKSSTTQTDKAKSTPNRASGSSRQTASSPITPQEHLHRAIKAEPDADEKLITTASANIDGDAICIMPEGLAWDTPKPNPPPVAAKKDNPRWPKTRGTRQKTVWPKQSEMRARSSDSSVDGGVACKSDSDGDPDYDVKKLMDWNGDWIPPPEQWTGRKGHTNRHLGRSVEEWIDGHPKEIYGDHLKYNESPTFCEDGEIAPSLWVINKIEQGSLGEFWKSMPAREPQALSDVSERAPFWERYREDSDCIINALQVPDARVDPEDLNNHRQGQDLLASGEENLADIVKFRHKKQLRSQKRQNRPVPVMVPTGPSLPDRRIVPKANVYFRPVQPRDVEGIAAIYNHYVDETIYANEFDVRTAEQIGNRINVIVQEGLPYLVAIAKGNHSRVPTSYVQEKVVGYANLDDYCDRSSMYRYSFELELFVHPGYTSQNIASCLLDALLEMSNTGYNACGGYEYRNESEYLKMGPNRVIKTITLTVCKENGESADSASDFLKRFKFARCGHIPKIGYKFGKVVDAHFYQHATSEDINPNSRPSVPL